MPTNDKNEIRLKRFHNVSIYEKNGTLYTLIPSGRYIILFLNSLYAPILIGFLFNYQKPLPGVLFYLLSLVSTGIISTMEIKLGEVIS